MVATGSGRAFVDRLQLAVDVRLIDDVSKWPELARKASRIVDQIGETARTRRRVFDELSPEERLLHAVAQALGGQLDDREARMLHDQTNDTDRDVPFIAIVLASRGFDTERARSVYLLALDDKLSPALEESLRMAFERGFPPSRSDRLPARVRQKLLDRWPSTAWSRIVRALAGDEKMLAELATEQPQLLAGAGPRVIDALVTHARWRKLLDRLGTGTAEDQRARLGLLASAAAWRFPLPAAAIGAALATTGASSDASAIPLALATGDTAGAAQLARSRDDALGDFELACARGLALLGGTASEVRALGTAAPALHATAAPGGALATASAIATIHAALFALEVGDRAALRALATPLAVHRETAWGRVLLARVYIGMGEPSLVEPLLFREDGPVAALLRARALASTQLETAIAWLRDLFMEYPGWSEARLRYGLALAASDPRRGLAILEEAPATDEVDTAVLGPPATARAVAQLSAAELLRREKRPATEVAMRIRVALALAPTSPHVARQAATIAVAIRDAALAKDAHDRLRSLAPNAVAVQGLSAGILELAGDLDGAIAAYRTAGAWDRVIVLSALRAHRDVELPEITDLDRSTGVAALHAVAVLATKHGDLALAARALERAVARRPDYAGLASDFVTARLGLAKQLIAEGDVADLFYGARELEGAAALVDDARLRAAHAAVVLAMCGQWIRIGELDRARVRIDELLAKLDLKRDSQTRTLVTLHASALALRQGRIPDARQLLDTIPESDHVRLQRALIAVHGGNHESFEALMPTLLEARTPAVSAAGRVLEIALTRTPGDLAMWALAPTSVTGARPEALGTEAALYLAYLLAETPESGAPRSAIAALLERVADALPADLDGVRRCRLAALGFRVTAEPPEPVDIEALDLGLLAHGDEREVAIGIIAHEVRRRRRAGEKAAAHAALSRLVMLVRPTGAIGVLALASIEDAADAALAAWRTDPSDEESLQTALATQLRRALSRELGGSADTDCLAAWQVVIGLLGPVLVSTKPWHALAAKRRRAYNVPQLEIANARAACQRRIADILVALGKWHASRGNDAARATARLEEVKHQLATELSIARTVETLLGDHAYELDEAFPLALGPTGLDLVGRRARAVEALAEIESGEHVTAAADLRGILAGALLEGWVALHDGRLDVAEQTARDRMSSLGRPDGDAMRLLAALYVRRIREALDENDLNGAGEIAAEWVTREHLPELPEELAVEIANVCRGIFDRYGINPARRKLQQIRKRHDDRTLRDVEAELVLRYLDRGRATDAMDRTRLLVEVMQLSPSESTRNRLHEQLVLALSVTKEIEVVDEILALLSRPSTGGAPMAGTDNDALKLADCIVAVQVKKSELNDRRLRATAALETRVEELRRVLDMGRSAGVPVGRLLDRLVFLHDRLQQVYETAGNPAEAQRHQRRAAAYRNWHASEGTS